MAADPGQSQASFRHPGAGVVRAARAVVGRARRRINRMPQHGLLCFQKSQPRLDQVAGSGFDVQPLDALGNHACNLRHREVGGGL